MAAKDKNIKESVYYKYCRQGIPFPQKLPDAHVEIDLKLPTRMKKSVPILGTEIEAVLARLWLYQASCS